MGKGGGFFIESSKNLRHAFNFYKSISLNMESNFFSRDLGNHKVRAARNFTKQQQTGFAHIKPYKPKVATTVVEFTLH